MSKANRQLLSYISRAAASLGIMAGVLFAAAPPQHQAIDSREQVGNEFAEFSLIDPPLLELYHVHEEVADTILTGSDLITTGPFILRVVPEPVPDYCADRCAKSAKLYVRFDVNGDDEIFDNDSLFFNSSLTVEFKEKDGNGLTISSTITRELNVGAAADSIASEQWLVWDVFDRFPDTCGGSGGGAFTGVELDLKNYVAPSGALADSVRLHAKIVVEYAIDAHRIGHDCGTDAARIIEPIQAIANHPMTFEWQNIGSCVDSFPNYQFQLLRLFNTDTAFRNTPQEIKTRVDWDKALTLETFGPKQELTLTLAEGTGFYVWRVRPIGDFYEGGIANSANWGCWTLAPPDDTVMTVEWTGSNFDLARYEDCLLYYTQFDVNLNFIYGRTFSEGQNSIPGISETINYADGLLFSRQQQAKLQSQDCVLVSGSIYDYSGRPALAPLGAPVNQDKFNYVSNLYTADGELYRAEHFDTDGNYRSPEKLDGGPVADYWSSVNSDAQIPSADSLPFARTLFYPEASGRVQEQSGPGLTHSLYGGRTVKTFFTGASDKELVSVFGDEAPYVDGVTRILSIDQNNVASVQYLEKEGRVLASCLLFQPGNDSLLFALDQETLSNNTVNALTIADTITSPTSMTSLFEVHGSRSLYLSDTVDVTLRYTINPKSFSVACQEFCRTCDYYIIRSFRRIGINDSTLYRDTLVINPELCPAQSMQFSDVIFEASPGLYILERWVETNRLDTIANPDGDIIRPVLNSYCDTVGTAYKPILQDTLESIFGAEFLLTYYHPDSTKSVQLYDSLLKRYLNYYATLDSAKLVGIDTCCSIWLPPSPCVNGCDPPVNFEEHLFDLWRDSLDYATDNLNMYFRDFNGNPKFTGAVQDTGMFNAMIANMQAEGYDCYDLWRCWQNLVENLPNRLYVRDTTNLNLLTQDDTLVYAKGYDLLESFIDCAEFRLSKFSNSMYGSDGWLTFPWRIYPEPDNDCKAALGFVPLGTLGDTLWHLSVANDSQLVYDSHRKLYQCARSQLRKVSDSLQFVNDFGGQIPDINCGSSSLEVCMDSVAALLIDSCEARCAARSQRFRDSLAYAFRDHGTYVQRVDSLGVNYSELESVSPLRDTISAVEFNCLADMLMEHCEDQCQLTVVTENNEVVSLGTAEELVNFQNALSRTFFKVDLPNMCGDCPDTEYDQIIDSVYTDTLLLSAIDTLNCHLKNVRDTMTNTINFWKFYNSYLIAAGIYGPLMACLPDTSESVIVHKDIPSRFRREQVYNQITQQYSCRIVYVTPIVEDYDVDQDNQHVLIGVLNEYLNDAWAIEVGPDSFVEVDNANTEYLNGSDYYSWSRGYYFDPNVDPLHHEWDSCYNDLTQTWEYCDRVLACINESSDAINLADVVNISSATRSKFQRSPGDTVQTIAGTYSFEFFGMSDTTTFSITLEDGDRVGNSLLSIDLIFDLNGESDTCRFNSSSEKFELTSLLDSSFQSAIGYFRESDENALEFYLPLKERSYRMGSTVIACDGVCDIRQEICDFYCDTLRCDRVCFKWTDPPEVDSDQIRHKTCAQMAVEMLIPHVESQLYDGCLENAINEVKMAYTQACGHPNALEDEFIAEYSSGFYHYTLYYYDRAGNLIKTIPPAGVDLEFADTLTRRARPNHTMATTYEYNSLGQLVKQNTPDGGTTEFWYNAAGQLRISQNAEQKLSNEYSYTTYDPLGRIVEVGQTTMTPGSEQTNADNSTFPTTNKEQITQTGYTSAASPSVSYPVDSEAQQYLRNRVSWTLTDHDGDLGSSDDQVKTVYSYDVHGNVKWLMQDLPGLGQTFVKYEYDLISGRVQQVILREGKADEFRYRYRYDDDGRLLCAESSSDGIIWEEDAKYAYYAHGPLRRVELGDDRIQGLDYTYTIQGWLKAINHPAPDPGHAPSPGPAYDPGGDGADFAADAFAMTLSYFPDDFTNYSGGSSSPFNNSSIWNLDGSPLYNGNISAWTMNTAEVAAVSNQYEQLTGYTFEYDLLNRIKKADFQKWNSSTNQFDAVTDYSSAYSYDPNGNIDSLKRWGKSGTLFDEFKYNYKTHNNQLEWVADNIVASATPGDIESGQTSVNYHYDAIGNLTRDDSEGINDIDWTAYGKIRKVEETATTRMVYTYDAAGNRVMKEELEWGGGAFGLKKKTWYIRDAAGTVLSQYEKLESGDTTTRQTEVPLYGGKRLGLFRPDQDRYATVSTPAPVIFTRYVNERQFELSDHLGNVRAVVSDVKARSGADFAAKFKAYNNYYPFGMLQPERSWQSESYRFGFQGQEMDNEVKGEGNAYNFGARIHDPRLGRFLSVDPLVLEYPWQSPYSFAANSPIAMVDEFGENPRLTEWIKQGARKGKDIWKAGKSYASRVFSKQNAAAWGDYFSRQWEITKFVFSSGNFKGWMYWAQVQLGTFSLKYYDFLYKNKHLIDGAKETVWGLFIDVESPSSSVRGEAFEQGAKMLKSAVGDALADLKVQNVSEELFNAELRHIDIGGEGRYTDALNFNPNKTNTSQTENIPNLVEGFAQETLKNVRANSVDLITIENAPTNNAEIWEQVGRVLKNSGMVRVEGPLDESALKHLQKGAEIIGGTLGKPVVIEDYGDYQHVIIEITRD